MPASRQAPGNENVTRSHYPYAAIEENQQPFFLLQPGTASVSASLEEKLVNTDSFELILQCHCVGRFIFIQDSGLNFLHFVILHPVLSRDQCSGEIR